MKFYNRIKIGKCEPSTFILPFFLKDFGCLGVLYFQMNFIFSLFLQKQQLGFERVAFPLQIPLGSIAILTLSVLTYKHGKAFHLFSLISFHPVL